jgi:S-adenosylmethionine hydrolase
MAFLTLTSDMGIRDPYIPALKGWVYSQVPQTKITDITHQVQRNAIQEAAYVLRHCIYHFPPQTVHLVSVDIENDATRKQPPYVVTKTEGQWVIVRNHGLVSLVAAPDRQVELVAVLQQDQTLNPELDIAAPAAVRLLRDGSPEHIEQAADPRAHALVELAHQAPTLGERSIRGTVIYTDHYGNAVTNIRREHLERFEGFPQISFGPRSIIRGISHYYCDVPVGESLSLINSAGYLEIALHQGQADKLLGLQVKSLVRIDFV